MGGWGRGLLASSYPGCGCRTGRAWTAARGCRSWWGAPLRCSPADTSGCGTLWRAHWAGWSPPAASRRRAAARRAALRSPWPCGRWRRGWGAGASARWHCGPPLSWCQSQAELWALRRQGTQGELRRRGGFTPLISRPRPQGSFSSFEIFLLLWVTPGGCVRRSVKAGVPFQLSLWF